MADAPESTPKIDSLRAKVEADPKSRHFYPLAEELRKIGQLENAENVLRAGLAHHQSYLSAWISLGRVLKERGSYAEAVDVLMKGLSLDPENVVAAKLLANVYMAMGDKVEAIKKFKLVYALMPADEEAETQINELDRALNPEKYAFATPAVPPPAPAVPPPAPAVPPPPAPATAPSAQEPTQAPADSQPAAPAESLPTETDSRIDGTEPPFPTGSDAPLGLENPAHEPEPFHEPTGESPSETNLDLTNPDPFSLVGADAPGEKVAADQEAPFGGAEPSVMDPDPGGDDDPFGAVAPEPPREPSAARAPSSEDVWSDEDEASGGPAGEAVATVTMAQILAEQGYIDRARETYERVLERDPQNEEAREGLISLSPKSPRRLDVEARVSRLESWRQKVVGS